MPTLKGAKYYNILTVTIGIAFLKQLFYLSNNTYLQDKYLVRPCLFDTKTG